jgi:hypothetical protein
MTKDEAIDHASFQFNWKLQVHQRLEITDLFDQAGFFEAKWKESVIRIKGKMKFGTRVQVSDVLDIYSDLTSLKSDINCEYCRKSGWLKVVILNGTHNNKPVNIVYDYNDPERHYLFLQKNTNFVITQDRLPCICGKGSEHNMKNKNEWVPNNLRNQILKRSIRFSGEEDAANAYEDYYQTQTVHMLSELIQGRNYTVKDIKDYPDMAGCIAGLREKFNEEEKVNE